MEAFVKIPQRIICKWEQDTPPDDTPTNIFMTNCLPHQDLLTFHEAILYKLFIKKT